MTWNKLILAFFTTLSLLASGTTAAFSQGHMAGSQSIVICSPSGAHEIRLGANGEPVETEHECHDCCFFFADGVKPHDSLGIAPTGSIVSLRFFYATSWLSRDISAAYARGPPLFV